MKKIKITWDIDVNRSFIKVRNRNSIIFHYVYNTFFTILCNSMFGNKCNFLCNHLFYILSCKPNVLMFCNHLFSFILLSSSCTFSQLYIVFIYCLFTKNYLHKDYHLDSWKYYMRKKLVQSIIYCLFRLP